MNKQTKIILTRKWPTDVEASLDEHYTVMFNPDDTVLDKDEIIHRCNSADILCPTISDKINAEFIEDLPKSIRLIASFGAGVEHIDIQAARERGIQISNTPGSVVEDTADIAFGLMIATARRFSEGMRELNQGEWQGFSLNYMVGRSVHHKTLGIIGLGAIGQSVARRAKGFSMDCIYYSRTRKPEVESELGLTYMDSLDALLKQADFVSLHCALTPETRHLIDTHAFTKMKSSAILINTSRGSVMDESALIEALQHGTIAAAGLDVYEQEPHVPQALIDLDNTLLIPHLGTASIEARNAMGFQVLENIKSYLDSGKAINKVN